MGIDDKADNKAEELKGKAKKVIGDATRRSRAPSRFWARTSTAATPPARAPSGCAWLLRPAPLR